MLTYLSVLYKIKYGIENNNKWNLENRDNRVGKQPSK